MTKKKRGHPDIEEVLARPWCYYCERDFDDLKILISHQKAKHFKCERCGRRLNTAGGLSVHMNQVHKETLGAVENALPNRSNLDVEIFGMEGIPDDVIQQHNQRVLSQFHQAELEHRANSGNPAPGSTNAANKKPKFESPSDLKKRLAEHKAKKAAQEAGGGGSGDATPTSADHGVQSPGVSNSPAPYQQPPVQHQYPALLGNPAQPAFPQPYGQPGFSYSPQQPQFPQPPGGFLGGPPGFPQVVSQPFPPATSPLPGGMQYPPNGAIFPLQYSNQFAPPFPSGHPSMHMQQTRQPPPIVHSNSIPSRPPGLPAAPGLPQRPSLAAPAVNAFQMQQLHQINGPNPVPFNSGGLPTPPASEATQDPRVRPTNGVTQPYQMNQIGQSEQYQASLQHESATASSVDDLIASAARESHAAEASKTASVDANEEKKSKKDKAKDKPTKLIYSDNEFSPEEKMAQMPRYAFVPANKEDKTLGNIMATVTETSAITV